MAKFSTSRDRPATAIPQAAAIPGVEAAVLEKPEFFTDAAPETRTPESSDRRRPIDLIEGAKRQLKGLIGYPVDVVSGFARSEDGWALTITVVELNRIPPGTDILAEYVADLDKSGEIVGYRRGRRFCRSEMGNPE